MRLSDNRLGIAIVVGLLIIGFFYRSAVTEYLFGPSTAPVSPATRGARSSTASSQGGAIAANMSNDSPEIAEVRARRLKRFALDVPQAVSVEDPADTTGGGSVDVALQGEPDMKPKKNVFSLPALPTGATEIKDVAVQNISDGVGIMKPANTTEETSTHVEVADPIAVTPAVRAEEGQETSVPPMEEEVIEKTYTEEEQVRYIFGGAVTLSDISAATLRRLLLREPVTTRSLAIAANWWMSAVHISALPRWEEIIIVSMGELLTERTPEEDLYTPAPEEEVARAVLELMGYRVTTGNRPQLKASDVKFPVSVSFIRALQKAGPECCTSSLRLLMSCFGYYQLDTLVPDFFDMRLLSSIRNDKCLGALVAGVMSDESRNTDMSNPGEFEKGVALSRLLSVSAIVPLSALNLRGTSNTAHQSQYPQMSYFSGMPSSPIPTKLWCTNPSLLLRHTRMITSNTTELLDLLHGLVERAAKQNRDAVLSWVAHFVQLNHDFFSIGGRAALYDDEGSNPESCSSSGILNLSYVLLKLMAPLLKNSKQFVPSVDWEYTKDDSRIRFSRLPNMVDGSKPGMAAIAIGNQSETSDGMAGCGSSPQIHNNNRNYSFSTELFWLTARAMELVDKISTRRQEQMRSCWDFFDHAKQLYTTNQSSHSGAVLEHARQCLHTFHYGWVASQLEDPNYLALACSWSKFVSDWILSQAAAEDATIRFYYIPAGLVKAMCDIWILTAHLCPDIAMPGLLAADAALLCVELMGRPDLASSPVVQDRLLAVVDAFVVSGKESLVGVVMNNQIIRESLAPAIMLLYSKCHAVAALDVNEDVAFDKNSIRSRANDLIKHLYNYPLDEPRDSIRSFVSGVGFEAFVSSAFDCIMYNFVEAVKTLKYNCKNEKMNRPVDSRAPNNVRWMLRLTASTFDVLRMLCDGESCVRDKMVGESLRYRVSSCIYSCLDYVNSAEKLELLRVKDPETWGYEESSVIGQSVNLLSSCLSVADNTKQSNFLAAFSEHPDFEIEGLLRLVELPGGSALKHFCTRILENAPKSTGGPKHSGNIVGASTTVLSPMDVDFDVFAEEEEDAEDIYAAFWMEEDQVVFLFAFNILLVLIISPLSGLRSG